MESFLEENSHKKAVADHFSEKAKYWIKLYDHKEYNNYFVKYELAGRKEIVKQFVNNYCGERSVNILDVGCGTGILIKELAGSHRNITGVDISDLMLEAAKKNTSGIGREIKFYNSEVEKLPFENNQFDVITCVGVLEYLFDEEKGLQELCRVLKTNGILIITYPNLTSLKNLSDPHKYIVRGFNFIKFKLFKPVQKKKNIGLNTAFSNKRYRLKSFDKFLESEGLQLLSVKSVAFGPFTFWKKEFLPLETSLRLSKFLADLSDKKYFRLLKKFSNRWVGCYIKK